MNMTEDVVLTANRLRCAYPGQKGLALSIDDFALHRGKIHFVLGPSGIGKSTLIESLGLMERTAKMEYQAEVQMHKNGASVDLLEVWGRGEEALSKFRMEHFSFIFQSTNLLPNLSLIENVLMPAWIEGRQSIKEMNNQALALFSTLLPDIKPDDWSKDITAVAGGQRQRLAFIRALMSSFTVLFGDEPTGNLDAWRARIAMNLLAKELHSRGGTACIVSHDINLAVSFADAIYLLTPEQSAESAHVFGTLKPEHKYHKSDGGWTSERGKRVTDADLLLMLNEALKE